MEMPLSIRLVVVTLRYITFVRRIGKRAFGYQGFLEIELLQ